MSPDVEFGVGASAVFDDLRRMERRGAPIIICIDNAGSDMWGFIACTEPNSFHHEQIPHTEIPSQLSGPWLLSTSMGIHNGHVNLANRLRVLPWEW